MSVLTGHRRQEWTYELLDRTGAVLGLLTGARPGGRLTWTANQSVKGRGDLLYLRDTQDVDWLTARIRITLTVHPLDGGQPVQIGMGVWVPSVSEWTHAPTGATAKIPLLSRETILARQGIPHTYSLAAGTNIAQAVRDLIIGAGEPVGAISDSDAALAVDRVWEPHTSRLRIINDLAIAGGFFSLFSDSLGQYRLEPSTRATTRPIAWRFDGETRVIVPTYPHARDLNVPNVVPVRARTEHDEDPLTAVARNDDPNSPLSTVHRGEVWADVEDVDAADLETLEAYASRRLAEHMSIAASATVTGLTLPLWFNDAVTFEDAAHGVTGRHVVTSRTVELTPTGLSELVLREVVGD